MMSSKAREGVMPALEEGAMVLKMQ